MYKNSKLMSFTLMIQLPEAIPTLISPLSKWMRDDPSFNFFIAWDMYLQGENE